MTPKKEENRENWSNSWGIRKKSSEVYERKPEWNGQSAG
jgi:hypothetical protein